MPNGKKRYETLFSSFLRVLLLVALAAVSYYSFFWVGGVYERNKIRKIGEDGVQQAVQFFEEREVDKAIATLYLSASLSEHRTPENVARLEKETACLLGRGFLLKSKYCLSENYLKYAEALPYEGGLTSLCSRTYERMNEISDSCAWQKEQAYLILSKQDH
ncbi:MAG: hypothetical protein LBI35_04875 [Burkholderiales bacterium]|nr:hypothetical protein [Burkholderiales bacterium]